MFFCSTFSNLPSISCHIHSTFSNLPSISCHTHSTFYLYKTKMRFIKVYSEFQYYKRYLTQNFYLYPRSLYNITKIFKKKLLQNANKYLSFVLKVNLFVTSWKQITVFNEAKRTGPCVCISHSHSSFLGVQNQCHATI
jgi:hypothetical protein